MITRAAKARGKSGGLDGAFRETWDLLLQEAEGLTIQEARGRGLRFHPAEFAIPRSQHDRLLRIWVEYRGPRHPRQSAVEMLWFTMGPASYPENESP